MPVNDGRRLVRRCVVQLVSSSNFHPVPQSPEFIPTVLTYVCKNLQNCVPSRTQSATRALCTQLLVLLIDDLQHSLDRAAIVIAAFVIFQKSLEDAGALSEWFNMIVT